MFVDQVYRSWLSDFQDLHCDKYIPFFNVRYSYHCNLVYVAVHLALLHITLGSSRTGDHD